MPIITVATADHPDIGSLLLNLADDVAETLELGCGDVIVVHTPTGASATSGADAPTAVSAWHIVSIHGSDRGRDKMEAAARVAEATVRSWCEFRDVKCEGVWTQWLKPIPA